MQITFNLPHAGNPGSTARVNAPVVRALLDALIEINLDYLRLHPHTRPLYRSGVRYGRTRTWDEIPAMYSLGFGDCKSLSAALIAERRLRGVKVYPSFRWARRTPGPDGIMDFHILVQTGPSTFEDPSRILGMGANEFAPFAAQKQQNAGARNMSSVIGWDTKFSQFWR